MGTEVIMEDEGQKKGRRRKKQLYNSILQQMEFYFSDANLSKDRFLSTVTKEDPYVDVSLFLNFNKVRKLTSNVKDITKAIAKSDLLELSEDNTKVKRKLPIIKKENVDECTIYVERLNPDVTHETLTSIFSEYGDVAYVSIPKYKHSGMIKGFAFVEFKEEDSVQTALQHFEKIGCKIPSTMEPEKLSSIITYNIETNESNKKASPEEPASKRCKLEEEVIQEETPADDTDQDISTSDDKRKKKHKKSHKKKSSLKTHGLQILSKKEWKKMRNRYLDMQRKSMKELKLHLGRQRFAQKYNAPKAQIESVVQEVKEEKIKAEVSDIEFVPNVIVKLALSEACFTPKVMRKTIKTFAPDIKYVEVPFGSTDAYLRFGDCKSAEEFCSSDYKDKTHLLEGDEEKEYWNKISESATIKKEKQVKVNKKRGRDKLLKKAEKHALNHIRFNEEAVE